jgi:addiction module RelE/StbE family toxin
VKVRWARTATQDLASIIRHIRRNNPQAAQRVKATIAEELATLNAMPLRGRHGIVEGTREIVFAPLPYIAVYLVFRDEVQILRIRHAAQDWP